MHEGNPRLLVDLQDRDAISLALSAVDALPDVTALLVLADRLAELADAREYHVRRFAELVNRHPDSPGKVTQRRLNAALEDLQTGEIVLAAWLMLRWASVPDDIRPPVKLAALVPMHLHHWQRVALMVPSIPHGDYYTAHKGRHALWQASASLIDLPHGDDMGSDWSRRRAACVLRQAVEASVHFDRSPRASAFGKTALARARGVAVGCIGVVTGTSSTDYAALSPTAASSSLSEVCR